MQDQVSKVPKAPKLSKVPKAPSLAAPSEAFLWHPVSWARLCKCWPYHRHSLSVHHRLALLTGNSIEHAQDSSLLPKLLCFRHCLPSWFTVHSQAILHFPQSSRHFQSPCRTYGMALAGCKSWHTFLELALGFGVGGVASNTSSTPLLQHRQHPQPAPSSRPCEHLSVLCAGLCRCNQHRQVCHQHRFQRSERDGAFRILSDSCSGLDRRFEYLGLTCLARLPPDGCASWAQRAWSSHQHSGECTGPIFGLRCLWWERQECAEGRLKPSSSFHPLCFAGFLCCSQRQVLPATPLAFLGSAMLKGGVGGVASNTTCRRQRKEPATPSVVSNSVGARCFRLHRTTSFW